MPADAPIVFQARDQQTPRAPSGALEQPPASTREIWFVYSGFMVVMALAALDQSIVATALPRIVSDLGGVTHISWVVTAYVLASISVMPLYGKLSDQYGRKTMIYVAIAIFLIGSALSGLSQSMTELILFRAVQGLGAGGLIPLSQIVIADLVPPRERGRYQGNIGIVFAVCSVAGPAIGGFITQALSWHWIFYINLPIGVIAFVMIAITLKRSNPTVHRSIDYAGAALLAAATTCLLLVMSLGGTQFPWVSLEILGMAALGLALAACFVARERYAREPIMPLGLFRNKVFVIGVVTLAFAFMGMQGATTFFPLFFQVVLGVHIANSGMLTAPMLIGIVVSAKTNGLFVYRSGRYKPLQTGGIAMGVLAFAVLAWAAQTSQSLWVIEPALVALGLGLGMVNPNMVVAIQNAVDKRHLGSATASSSFFRSLGGVIGVAASGAILARQLQSLLASTKLPGGVSARQILSGGTVQLNALPPAAHALVVAMYRHAIATCFAGGALTTLLALIAALIIPELPLRAQPQAKAKG
ncbi:MAG TPA: MDR family MFS transporter [Beijerinckiaceae bacterium]|nr:MDR family MFS transporter [Beijerinckiaceae bacterium]